MSVARRSHGTAWAETFPTAFGPLTLLFAGDIVTDVFWCAADPESKAAARAPLAVPRDPGPLAERLIRYCLSGDDDFADLSLPPASTPFGQSVIATCRAIPPGTTRSYGELAAAAGSPRASRAVGQLMARNRLPLLIPCHRVIAADGGLGGYSAGAGLPLKQRLLELERRARP